MVTIYYPYWARAGKWHELRYSLRSLEKNLKADFEVCLVGDKPEWIQHVRHIAYERSEMGVDSSVKNTLRMMDLFMNEVKTDSFIRMYDDVYFIAPCTLDDLHVTRIIRKSDEVFENRSGGSRWQDQVKNTIYALRELGYEGYMTESHCPELFSVKNMREIYRLFDLPRRTLLTSTLYYNVFPQFRSLVDRKTERALFYGSASDNAFSFSSEHIREKIADKRYLNHNDAGLNAELKDVLEELFPDKSRFEV